MVEITKKRYAMVSRTIDKKLRMLLENHLDSWSVIQSTIIHDMLFLPSEIARLRWTAYMEWMLSDSMAAAAEYHKPSNRQFNSDIHHLPSRSFPKSGRSSGEAPAKRWMIQATATGIYMTWIWNPLKLPLMLLLI